MASGLGEYSRGQLTENPSLARDVARFAAFRATPSIDIVAPLGPDETWLVTATARFDDYRQRMGMVVHPQAGRAVIEISTDGWRRDLMGYTTLAPTSGVGLGWSQPPAAGERLVVLSDDVQVPVRDPREVFEKEGPGGGSSRRAAEPGTVRDSRP